MTIEKIIEIIDSKDEIKYDAFLKEAITNGYYDFVTKEAEIIIALINEHNKKFKA